MVNISKLRGKIAENGLSVDTLSQRMGIHNATLYRKFNVQGETFTIQEAKTISAILHLTMDEVNSIFFADFVARNAN